MATCKTKHIGSNATLIKKLIKKPTQKPTQKDPTTISSSCNGDGGEKATSNNEIANVMLCVESELPRECKVSHC